MSILQIENLSAKHGLLQAVHSVSFSVKKGEVLAIVGANGAGKTTLLRTLAGAHPLSSGKITFQGRDITSLSSFKRVAAGLALVPEGRRLFTQMTVEENLLLAKFASRPGIWTLDKVLEAFPNLQTRRNHKCGLLSGGEQQATAIGRALMTNPELIILDEVSLGLSPLVVDRVYAQLQNLKQSSTTIILVEQDLTRALKFANRVICMLEGHIVLQGDTEKLTRDEVTKAYFGLDRTLKMGATS